ncbi:MAG: N-acetylmuramoyl-L-alanine amidase [Verrucomicrobia bacterium]|nr:N-acetylmuramoyl-L-alanine amidase [Verrucomicrobiota bacterium]
MLTALFGTNVFAAQSLFYDFKVVAKTGDPIQPGDPRTFQSFKPNPSINDNGKVAFIGVIQSGSTKIGEGVFVGDGMPANLQFLTPSEISGNKIFTSVWINNDLDQVAAALRVSGTPHLAYAKRFTKTNPAAPYLADPAVAKANTGMHTTTINPCAPFGGYCPITFTSRIEPFDDILQDLSMNDSGEITFTGLLGSTYYLTAQSAYQNSIGPSYLAGTFPHWQPVIDTRGWVVVRAGNQSTSPILRLAPNFANNQSDIIATADADSTHGGFQQLGQSPGQTFDNGSFTGLGAVVAFFGDLDAAHAKLFTAANRDFVPLPVTSGPGIFLSVPDFNGQRHIIRVAGTVTNLQIDPGERWVLKNAITQQYEDRGQDFNSDGNYSKPDWDWEIGSFVADKRVAVSPLHPFADPTKGSYATITYIAVDTNNKKGIYTSRVNFIKNASVLGATMVGVEAPLKVIAVNDTVAGFGTVTDVDIYAPVNSTGGVTFYAATATGGGIIRADSAASILNPLLNVSRPRFDPDSPLVDYVSAGQPVLMGRQVTTISQVVMHATADVEKGSLRTLTRDSGTSVHYLVSRQGRVTQMISEADEASHAWNENNPNSSLRRETDKHSIGIEHVDDCQSVCTIVNGSNVCDCSSTTGNINDKQWLETEQRRKSALLVRDICLRNSIPMQLLTLGSAGIFQSQLAGVSGLNACINGIDASARGILSHGSVIYRKGCKVDPQNFPWDAFLTAVNRGIGIKVVNPNNLVFFAMVTDSLGRRAGIDQASGIVFTEMPGSQFTGAGLTHRRFQYHLLLMVISIYSLQVPTPAPACGSI